MRTFESGSSAAPKRLLMLRAPYAHPLRLPWSGVRKTTILSRSRAGKVWRMMASVRSGRNGQLSALSSWLSALGSQLLAPSSQLLALRGTSRDYTAFPEETPAQLATAVIPKRSEGPGWAEGARMQHFPSTRPPRSLAHARDDSLCRASLSAPNQR